MVKKQITVTNRLGLHARPAAQIVQKASQFKSEIKLSKDGLEVNAKSIMGVMMLAAEMGSSVVILAEGPDEEAAAEAIAGVFAGKFGEE
ncbi:MAG: HPr family phosphocarrier protein [candidate division Zixibacteria bacterium]|nr:HPr family phosphocarrier protein [candidate division Zixibacteria bacterium]MCI0595295.1 HPr family phosphocarrier protein [candidate division Zixibacteria bacterium]